MSAQVNQLCGDVVSDDYEHVRDYWLGFYKGCWAHGELGDGGQRWEDLFLCA